MSQWPMPRPDEIVAQFPIAKNDRVVVALLTTKRGPVIQILCARRRADGRLPESAPKIALPARAVRQLRAALDCVEAMLGNAVPIREEDA